MAGEWKKLGSIRKGKTGNLYIKIDEGVTLAKGEALQLQDPRKKLKDSVAAGRLSEEKAEEFAAKIPEYIRYEIVKPPSN